MVEEERSHVTLGPIGTVVWSRIELKMDHMPRFHLKSVRTVFDNWRRSVHLDVMLGGPSGEHRLHTLIEHGDGTRLEFWRRIHFLNGKAHFKTTPVMHAPDGAGHITLCIGGERLKPIGFKFPVDAARVPEEP